MNSRQHSTTHLTQRFLGNAPGKTRRENQPRRFLLLSSQEKFLSLQQQQFSALINCTYLTNLCQHSTSIVCPTPCVLVFCTACMDPVQSTNKKKQLTSIFVPRFCCTVQYPAVWIFQAIKTPRKSVQTLPRFLCSFLLYDQQ
jgi:hypothetical protein